jgi:hypothetical protein
MFRHPQGVPPLEPALAILLLLVLLAACRVVESLDRDIPEKRHVGKSEGERGTGRGEQSLRWDKTLPGGHFPEGWNLTLACHAAAVHLDGYSWFDPA